MIINILADQIFFPINRVPDISNHIDGRTGQLFKLNYQIIKLRYSYYRVTIVDYTYKALLKAWNPSF